VAQVVSRWTGVHDVGKERFEANLDKEKDRRRAPGLPALYGGRQ